MGSACELLQLLVRLTIEGCSARYIKLVDELVMTLCYLYHKLSKKLREIKSLLKDIKEDFEMSVKSTATHWIDHHIQAMGHVIDYFGQYARHLKDFFARKKSVKSKQLFKVR